MTLPEYLLKLTDYPFSYSLVGVIFFTLFGESISTYVFKIEFLPVLTIIAILGTAFAIIDPFGRIIKYLSLKSSKVSVPTFDRSGLELFNNKNDEMDKMFLEHVIGLYSQNGYVPDELKRDLRRMLLKIQNEKLDREQELSDVNGMRGEAIPDSIYRSIMDIRNDLLKAKKKEEFLTILDFTITVDTTASSAIQTSWINTEINKIVAITYFASIIVVFYLISVLKPVLFVNYFLNTYEAFSHQQHIVPLLISENFYSIGSIQFDFGKLITNYMTFETITSILAVVLYSVLLALLFVLYVEIRFLQTKIRTVVVYMLTVERQSSELTDYSQKMNQHLSNGEWVLADLWAKLAYKKL